MRQSFSAILIIISGLSYPSCGRLDVYGAFLPVAGAHAGQTSVSDAGVLSAPGVGDALTHAPSAALPNGMSATGPAAAPAADPTEAVSADAAVTSPIDDPLCLRADEASGACEARKLAFGHAVCSCGDIVGTGMLSSQSIDPAGRAPVGTNGSLSLRIGRRGAVEDEPGLIDGSLTIAGLGPAAISGIDAIIRGDLALAGELTFAGNVHVTGSVYARRSPRGSGLLQIDGDLHHAVERVPSPLSSNVQVAGQVIQADYASAPACACNAGNIVELANAIAAAESAHDDTVAALSRDAMSNLTAARSFDLRCGRHYFRSVSSLSSITWQITGHALVFVAGDFALGGDVTVTLAEGAQLDLFVGGNLLVAGAARFGDPARPAASRIYVLGGLELATLDEPAVRSTGSASSDATIIGNFYAPTATLQLAPHTTVFGALFVRQLLVLQSLSVQYDPTVTTEQGARCEM